MLVEYYMSQINAVKMKYLVYLSAVLFFTIITTCILFHLVFERLEAIDKKISSEIDIIRQRRESHDSLMADYKKNKLIRDEAWKIYLKGKKLSKTR